MLIVHKDYNFSVNDRGKTVILANFQRARISSIIKEEGQTHLIGLDENENAVFWDANGKSDIPKLDIMMILET